MNKKTYIYLYLFILYLLYIILFIYSNNTAQDRTNYFDFFANPEASRFEPGFVAIGIFFNTLNINPEVSILLVVSLMFFMAAKTVRLHFISKPYTGAFIFSVIFFGICALYSFIQIRSGFALWFSLLLFSLFLKDNRKIYLFLMLLGILFHYSVVFFICSALAFYWLKMNKYILFILVTFVFFISSFFLEDLIRSVGLSTYYLKYIGHENENVRTSLTIHLLLLFLVLFPYFKNRFKMNDYYLFLLAIPPVIIAYITYNSMFVKLVFPMIVLFWLGGTKAIFAKKENNAVKQFIYACLMLLIPLSVMYSVIRSGIL